MAVKMEGIARSVNSIALQADFFSKVGIITSPIFSNIDRQSDGVHFSFTATVHPSAIRYAQLAAAAGGAGIAPPAPSAQPATQTVSFPAAPAAASPAPATGFSPVPPSNP